MATEGLQKLSLREVTAGSIRRLLRMRNRSLESAFDSEKILRRYIELGHSVLPNHYTDADPFKVISVDPNSITYRASNFAAPASFGRVAGGGWDFEREPITENRVYTSFFRHFREGVGWEETNLYENHRARIQEGGRAKGCRTVDELLSWYEEIDELYEKIQEEGYKSQRELLREEKWETIRKCNDASVPERNEVGVNIGRDGEFIWRHRGQHRLFIAKILGIDEIPVQVLTRHRQWQQHRYETVVDPTASTDHPDLADIGRA